jgi:Na+-translocating ferredoxin:NAD+ oxidoreductase subunit B
MKREAVAVVDEARCIGCTRCIDACPVDAIVGAAQQMHTVVEDWCIGCGLCLPPCPVDCIAMAPERARWTRELKQAAKRRAVERRIRLLKNTFDSKAADRKAVIAAALARKKQA